MAKASQACYVIPPPPSPFPFPWSLRVAKPPNYSIIRRDLQAASGPGAMRQPGTPKLPGGPASRALGTQPLPRAAGRDALHRPQLAVASCCTAPQHALRPGFKIAGFRYCFCSQANNACSESRAIPVGESSPTRPRQLRPPIDPLRCGLPIPARETGFICWYTWTF